MSEECISCPDLLVLGSEGEPEGECPKSTRPCGHHCNHSWTHDVCHFCGKEWVEAEE